MEVSEGWEKMEGVWILEGCGRPRRARITHLQLRNGGSAGQMCHRGPRTILAYMSESHELTGD